MNDERVLLRFIRTMLAAILRNALIGAAICVGIGLLIILLGVLTGSDFDTTPQRVLRILGNYALFGALFGGIIGILYGMLAQKEG